MASRTKYPIHWWRPLYDISFCYLAIGLSIWAALTFRVFYPLAILIIANRVLALSLLSHEALHGSLFKNPKINNFVGRWFCAFPTFISLSRYRKFHLIHHKTITHKTYDPDFHLYANYPLPSALAYLMKTIVDVLTLKTSWKFLQYYTDIPEFVESKEEMWEKFNRLRQSSDFGEFVLFYLCLFSFLITVGWLKYYLFFFLIPLTYITQPYVLLMGGLQHGPIQDFQSPELLSRSIRGPKWLMSIVLPLNINFHAEHHLDSSIPHYWLKTYAEDLEKKEKPVWKEGYLMALKALFKKTI